MTTGTTKTHEKGTNVFSWIQEGQPKVGPKWWMTLILPKCRDLNFYFVTYFKINISYLRSYKAEMGKLSMLFPEKAKVHITDKVNWVALTACVKLMAGNHSGSDWRICYPVWSQRKVQGLYVPGASERPCYVCQWPHQPQGLPGWFRW